MCLFKKGIVTLFVLFFETMVLAQGSEQPFIDAHQAIDHLDASLAILAKKTDIPVRFPQQIPSPTELQHYYLYIETLSPHRYLISVDSTPDCRGARYCNVGSVMASKGENPQIQYGMDNQELTVPVQLALKKVGYFTPAHSMADFWPSQLEWREKGVLYSLSWNLAKGQPEKETLLRMVNSINR
jgi:hypothetical protein